MEAVRSAFPGDDADPPEEALERVAASDQDRGAAASEDGANLEAAGVSPEELDVCVSVLQRLHRAGDQIDWKATELRELRKALAPHLGVFGQLPQKDAIDAKQRAKDEKNRKRERRQRQVEADRRWRDNAQLRASRLEKLEALEQRGPAAAQAAIEDADLDKASAAILDADVGDSSGNVEHSAETERSTTEADPTKHRRIPDGPAMVAEEAGAGSVEAGEGGGDYSRQQACYTCKARFSDRHRFYAHLCPACASLNFEKRTQVCDLKNRICLVTGARVKIGFQTALKLLRMGARVIATTRFPRDAMQRYAAEADSQEWLGRLEVRGVDFRFLGAVERFCAEILAQEAWLDVIVNNACQTIRRPAGYYRHLVEAEGALEGGKASPQHCLEGGGTATATGSTSSAVVPSATSALGAAAGGFSEEDSAAMSQLAVLAEDAMPAEEAAAVLPVGEYDAHGQQLDVRSVNTWLLKLGEVSTPEAVEVFCINALTPFTINGRLRPLLERSPHPDRYIVNVSAMEGKFYRYKQPTHPHTNMAKAALNMMTRTSAEEYARTSGIFMNSVDTGWINDENPLPTAQRIASDHGFQTPIDEVDAAARILDPVVTGVIAAAAAACASSALGSAGRQRKQGAGSSGGGGGGGGGADHASGPAWGRFFKDYAPTEW